MIWKKGEKREKREKSRKKINKGKNYDKICYLRGGGKIYFPPICTVYLLGGKIYHFERGERI